MSPRHLPWHFGNFIIIPNSSFNIKKYQPFERLLAYGTEVVNLIYTHAACVATAPYSIDEVSAAFDEACLASVDELRRYVGRFERIVLAMFTREEHERARALLEGMPDVTFVASEGRD